MDMDKALYDASVVAPEHYDAELIQADIKPSLAACKALALCEAIQRQRRHDFHLSGRTLAMFLFSNADRADTAVSLLLLFVRQGILELVANGNKKEKLATTWRFPRVLAECRAKEEERRQWQKH